MSQTLRKSNSLPLPPPSLGRQDSVFSMKGPDGAIIPRSPGASKKEEEPLKQADLEEDLGFNGPRKELREESDAEFIRAAGKQDAMMDRELFIESVGQLWDFDRASAKACFTAGDADGSGLINIHEWLILREAFVHQSEETAKHPIVRNLQLRAALFSYDVDANGHLSRDEVMTWLRDLCAGESHLQRIAKPVFKALDSEKQGRWPIPQAVQEAEDEDEDEDDDEPGIGTEAFVPLTLPLISDFKLAVVGGLAARCVWQAVLLHVYRR